MVAGGGVCRIESGAEIAEEGDWPAGAGESLDWCWESRRSWCLAPVSPTVVAS